MLFWPLRILGRVIQAVCYTAVAIVGFWLILFLITPFGWLFLPFAVLLAVSTLVRVRRRRVASVLGYVDQAVRLNLPLVPMVRAAANGESPRTALRLEALAEQLGSGATLAEALRHAVPEVSPRLASVVAAGEGMHKLPTVLARVAEQRRVEDEREGARYGMVWGYPWAVLAAALLVLMFLTGMVAPKFIEIFEDFDVALPPITVAFNEFSRWLGGPLLGRMGNPNQLVPGMLWILLGAFVSGLVVMVTRSTGLRDVLWYVPIAGSLERDRGLGDVCHVLEQALRAGLPMDAALAEAAELRVNGVLRRRVAAWSKRVHAGEPVDRAAREAGMPPLVSGLVATGTAGAGLPEALGFLRRFYDHRFSRTAAFVQAAWTPISTLLLAALVLWIALAWFVPLVVLIEATLPEGWIA